jgi:predicted kinase
VEVVGAVQIRSDVERKRLHGLAATDRPDAAGAALYGASSTQKTYAHLLDLAEQVVKAGWPVIIDAAFLERSQRKQFRMLASRLGVPFFIFDIRAGEQTLRRRVAIRSQQNRDASDAGIRVLLRQLAHAGPLAADEMGESIEIDTDTGLGLEEARKKCEPILRLRRQATV